MARRKHQVAKYPTSIDVPFDLKRDLDAIAKKLDRSRTWVMVHALKQYVEYFNTHERKKKVNTLVDQPDANQMSEQDGQAGTD